MRIHAFASQRHYNEHVMAVWRHFPCEMRGVALYGRFQRGYVAEDDVILVAGYSDIEHCGKNRVIVLEHGAGQRYLHLSQDMAPFYGGPYPDNVIAYLGPREDAIVGASIPGFAMGSPICDPYELYGEDGVVALTFHWKGGRVCPEAGSALNHYVVRLPEIVAAFREEGWEVLGHRHPKLVHPINLWSRLGVEEVDAPTVRKRASLLVADNTSLAYEMAYLGRQNIALNCPQYRKTIDHGLRFWDCPPGPMVEDADELIDMIHNMDAHLPRVYASTAANFAYGKAFSDGMDGFRSAAWLLMFLSSL